MSRPMLALQLKIGSVLDEKSFDELNGKVFFWDNWLKKSFAELKKQLAIFFFFLFLETFRRQRFEATGRILK